MMLPLLAITFTSCEDALETKNFTEMSPNNFFKSEGDIDAAVTGLYVPLTTTWGYSDGGTGRWYPSLFCADGSTYRSAGHYGTDEITTYSVNAFDEFTVGAANGTLAAAYNAIRFVARATDVINQIGLSSGGTEEVRARYIAEVKTLRAYYMYLLFDWFGPLNVKLDAATLMDNTITPRPTHEEYVGYMLDDLNAAVNESSFPVKYNDDNSNWGRMSKSVAWSILVKIYMHEHEWSKAKEAAEKVMGMGYTLVANYEDLFNHDRQPEHIFSVPANTASDNYYVAEVLPNDFKKGYNHLGSPYIRGSEDNYKAGWQAYGMRWEFYDTFEDNDARKATILCSYTTNAGTTKDRNTGMCLAIPLKYTDTQFNDFGCQKSMPVIRYAEILLSYAESVNEISGPTSEAIAAVKQVTDRAGVSIPQSATNDKDSFRSFLLAERGRELFGEGVRREDLIRHGEFIKRAVARGAKAQDYMVLYPIPQSVITEAGGIIKQNAGYPE